MARKLALALCKTIMVFCMLTFVVSFVLLAVAGRPEQTKRWLRESGAYSSTSESIRKSFSDSTKDLTTSDSPIVSDAIKQALPDSKIQSFVESGIDGTYGWLNGDTDNPQFSLDVKEIQTTFANTVANGLTRRAQNLPACPGRTMPANTDIFTMTCIPRGANVQAEIEKVRQQILSTDTSSIGENGMVDAQSIKVETAQGQQPYYQGLQSARDYYTLLKRLPLITAVIFLITGGILIILSKPRYRALRTFATFTVPYGILYLVAGLTLPGIIRSNLNKALQASTNNDMSGALKSIVNSIATLAASYFTKIGIVLVVIGAGCFAAYIVFKKRDKSIQAPLQTKVTNAPVAATK